MVQIETYEITLMNCVQCTMKMRGGAGQRSRIAVEQNYLHHFFLFLFFQTAPTTPPLLVGTTASVLHTPDTFPVLLLLLCATKMIAARDDLINSQ
jgi:hypothetical protein